MARIGQAIVGAATCVLIYRIGFMLMGPLTGAPGGHVTRAVSAAHLFGGRPVRRLLVDVLLCAVRLLGGVDFAEPRPPLAGDVLRDQPRPHDPDPRDIPDLLPCVCAAWFYAGRWPWRRTRCRMCHPLSGLRAQDHAVDGTKLQRVRASHARQHRVLHDALAREQRARQRRSRRSTPDLVQRVVAGPARRQPPEAEQIA